MAHLPTLRELRASMSALRDRVPLGCLLCGNRTPGGLCRYCRQAVCASMEPPVPRCRRCSLHTPLPDCPDCLAWPPALERVVAAFDYIWPGELLIRQLKLQGRFGCAPVLAGLLAERCRGLRGHAPAAPPLWCERRTWVTAVPASHRSLILRGYNPAGEVGRALARRLALEWRPDLILRSKEGRNQKSLSRRARRLGVEGMYRCPGGVRDREILIVDDVMTTGSTLNAIAQVLKAQGAARVWGAVLARTPSRVPAAGVFSSLDSSGTDSAAR